MTIATVPHGPATTGPLGRSSRPHSARRFRRSAAAALSLLTGAIWGGLCRTGVLTSRLIGWFADEPRRIRVTLLGVGACCLVGATVGVALGYALARLADLVLGGVQSIAGV